MNKLFLILLPENLDRDRIIGTLMATNTISFWFYNLPSSFFARSSLNAQQLQNAIVQMFPTDLILVIHLNKEVEYSGLVPKEQVDLFR